MGTQDTASLIEGLAEELEPTKRLQHPVLRTVLWGGAAVTYTVIVALMLKIRPDLANKATDAAFILEVSLATFTMITAALASAWLAVPDMRGKNWLPVLPLTGVGFLVFWSAVRFFTEGEEMPHLHWDKCFEHGALMAIMPLVAILVMTRKGTTCYPRLTAAMNILSVSMLGYVALRFTCVMDTVGHSGITHIMPFVLVALIMGLTSRKLYKW